VSFYALFSVAPITLIAVTAAGGVLGAVAARGELADQIAGLIGEEGSRAVEQLLAESRPEMRGWLPATVGVAALLVGATTMFAQLQQSLNAIWGVAPKPTRSGIAVLLVRRLLSFALVLTMGFLLLVSMVLTTFVSMVADRAQGFFELSPGLLRALDTGLALAVITVLFAMIFKVLPDVVLRWRDVWKGALLTAALFGAGRHLISLYLGQAAVASAYGAAGSLVLLLMWIYYSTLILLFGVEFTRANLEEGGREARPKSKAVRVRRELLEGEEGRD
jgi:membrane protein